MLQTYQRMDVIKIRVIWLLSLGDLAGAWQSGTVCHIDELHFQLLNLRHKLCGAKSM